MTALVEALFDLSDPLHAPKGFSYGEADLTSFEIYKTNILKSLQRGEQGLAPLYVPDDATLRGMYEAAKRDRIESGRFKARRSLTVSGLVVVVAVALFATHLIWVRRLAQVEA